jgi:hypothetical protein
VTQALERLLKPKQTESLDHHIPFVMRDIMQNKNDAVYTVVGYEGFGKSLLSRILAHAFTAEANRLRKKDDPVIEFSVKPVDPDGEGGNIQYPGQCFTATEGGLRYHPRGATFISDEAIASLFSRTTARNEQTALVQFLAMMRKRGFVCIFIIPSRRWADVFVRGHRSLYLFHTKEKFAYDKVGHLHGKKGTADFYFREDMGNIGPFATNPWWDKSGNFEFPGPEADPQDAEYEYWSGMHKDAFAAGFEAPWKDFPYSKGARPPSVDDMLRVVQRAETGEEPAKTFCYRSGERKIKKGWEQHKPDLKESKPGKDEDWT